MPNYDHYLFNMEDMGNALEQINQDGDKIISVFYVTDSNQTCVVTEKKQDIASFKEFIKAKENKER